MTALLLTFVWVSLLATLVPGPDTAVVVRNAVRGGRRHAVATAAGCSTGQLFWGAVSVAGLAGILATSVVMFSMVKWVGVAYLLYLGVRSLRSAARLADLADLQDSTPPRGRRERAGNSAGSAYRQGLLVNALNPKTALFMSALLPQFMSADQPVWLPVALVSLTAITSLTVMSLYGTAFHAAGDRLRVGRGRRALDGGMGVVLVGFAGRLAVQERP